ncbi:cupin domain-containing protein [uncultured Hoeflea sp.]|uniref:cupin domain-containing protein n=1 Tax=uncultured Hoeflea sp. TaxID=538666 RepID=UPI0030D81792
MPHSPQHVIAFDNEAVKATKTITSDPALVDRPYRSQSWRHFERADKGAVAGIWEAEPHLERVDCDYDELCHLLEGSVRLTDATGHSQIFEPGDSFIVAAGFKGTWETLSHVRKVFFILK